MKIVLLSIFPEIFNSFLDCSLIKKVLENKILEVEIINFREFADPPHYKVDDEIYGGGAGMLLKPDPLIKAIETAEIKLPDAQKILLSASGKKYTQTTANNLAKAKELILVCGRYEGVDQRVIDLKIDQEIAIGDFVCMGGEVPAMLLIESTVRLIENAIGNPESLTEESFTLKEDQQTLLEGPQYTRPAEFRGQSVPEILLSGDHQKITKWRKEKSQEKTKANRPDL